MYQNTGTGFWHRLVDTFDRFSVPIYCPSIEKRTTLRKSHFNSGMTSPLTLQLLHMLDKWTEYLGVVYSHTDFEKAFDKVPHKRQLSKLLMELMATVSFQSHNFLLIFTARRYASAVYAVIVCPSVRPSVCLSVCHKSVFYYGC